MKLTHANYKKYVLHLSTCQMENSVSANTLGIFLPKLWVATWLKFSFSINKWYFLGSFRRICFLAQIESNAYILRVLCRKKINKCQISHEHLNFVLKK